MFQQRAELLMNLRFSIKCYYLLAQSKLHFTLNYGSLYSASGADAI